MESRLVRSKSHLEQVLKCMIVEEQNKNYLAAHQLKNQANKLKNEIQNLEKKKSKQQQRKEIEDILDMHEEEFTNWRDSWDMEVKEFIDESQQLANELNAKHEEELMKLEEEFEEQFKQYHDSGAILELRRKEEIFSKQTNFLEAHCIQTERLKLEEQERQQLQRLKIEKLKIKIKKAKLRQQAEQEVLKQKTQTRLSEYQQKIENEEKVLLQKHKNAIRNLNSDQEKQNLTKSGAIKNTVSLTKSTSTTTTLNKMRTSIKNG